MQVVAIFFTDKAWWVGGLFALVAFSKHPVSIIAPIALSLIMKEQDSKGSLEEEYD